MVRLNLLMLNSSGAVALDNVPRWVQTGNGEEFKTDEPYEQLAELVSSDIDWQIDLTDAEPAEAERWIIADLFACHLRAKKLKKVVMVDNKVLNAEEFVPAVFAYCKEFNKFPYILQDNQRALIIGAKETKE